MYPPMSGRKHNDGMTAQRTYHHGNLREAALAAARLVIEENGHDALSMRELALQIQVAPSALYRHFSNRGDLLLAIANETHAELGAELRQVISLHPNPWDALEAACRAFLAFCLNNPGLFSMMYDDEVTGHPDSERQLTEQAVTYGLLMDLFRRALPDATPAQLRLRLVSMWSALFGYATTRAKSIMRSYMIEGLSVADMDRAMLEAALARPVGRDSSRTAGPRSGTSFSTR
jgi:AcrR family transcriptional regulator